MRFITIFYLILLFAWPYFSLAQESRVLQGIVIDENNKGLDNTSIVIKNISSNSTPIFQKSDSDGRFQIKISNPGKVELTISRLGYLKRIDTIDISSNEQQLRYKLQKSINRLTEVKIDYRYRAVEIAKDTIRFSADYFRDSTDRKLQDLIEKMPGFSIHEGKVRFHGKPVNVTLVENERFFGGGSKLAIENIPADAVDKVEMISRFSQNDLLRDVQVNDQLGMNIKLKENKKNFIFGDLESAFGSKQSYKEHAALFFYSPERTVSVIGDINNIGSSPISKEDIDRVQGAELQYFSNTIPKDALSQFNRYNRNIRRNINKFAAFNGFQKALNKKLSLTLYGAFSENRLGSEVEGSNTYLLPELRYTEKIREQSSQVNRHSSLNLSMAFKPSPYFTVDYNVGTMWTVPEQSTNTNNIIEKFAVDNSSLSVQKGNSFLLKQYLEGNWKHSLRSYSSFALQHHYSREKDNFSLSSDSLFLRDFIQFDSTKNYSIIRPLERQKHLFNASYKFYWIINQNQQFHIEANSQNETMRQSGASEGVRDSSDQYLFDHRQYYRNSSNYLGVNYRLDFDKLRILLSLKEYYLYLANQVPDYNKSDGQWFLQPELDIKYGKNGFDGFRLNYRRGYILATAADLNPSYLITGYNSLFRGNIFLDGQRSHRINFSYNKFRISDYRAIYFNSTLTLKDKIKGNSLATSSYQQLKGVILFNRPDLHFMNIGGYSIRYGRFEPGLYLSYVHMELAQLIDDRTINLQQNTVSTDLSLRWFKPKSLDIKVTWTNTNSWQKNSGTEQKVTFNKWAIVGKYNWKSLVFKTDWNLVKTGIVADSPAPVNVTANLELRYQRPKFPFSFYVQGLNILKNDSYRTALLTEYISTEKIIYTMPRVFLIGLSYSL